MEKVPEIVSYLRERYSDFEIVLVAKKSAESEAESLVQPLLKTVPCIRYLQLTDDGPMTSRARRGWRTPSATLSS